MQNPYEAPPPVPVAQDYGGMLLTAVPIVCAAGTLVFGFVGGLAHVGPGFSSVVGLGAGLSLIVASALLVARDRRDLGLGPNWVWFVLLCWLLGYPLYMYRRGKRSRPFGLVAGLFALACYFAPFVLAKTITTALASHGSTAATTRSTATGGPAVASHDGKQSPLASTPLVYASSLASCVVQVGGKLACWGADGRGAVPARHESVDPVVSIAGNGSDICVATIKGQIFCGFGSFNASPTHTEATIDDATSVGVGFANHCAVRRSGHVACWGSNEKGELGQGTTDKIDGPVEVAGIDDAKAIATGNHHSCVIRDGGTVWCWGDNALGQLGDGGKGAHPAPEQVGGLSGVTALSVGAYRTCAASNGGVHCWGGGVATPQKEIDVNDVVAVGAYDDDLCAVERTGKIRCVGANQHGQDGGKLGEKVANGSVAVPDAVGVSLGASHGCAVERNGRAMCWGLNTGGRLGDGTVGELLAPQTIDGIDEVTAVTLGADHTCALRKNGHVECVGKNAFGQVGDGSHADRDAFVPVTDLVDALQIAAGDNFTCARRKSGAVVCWGSGGGGSLGNGATTGSPVPVPVTGVTDAVAIAAGATQACAARRSGALTCWGQGHLEAKPPAHSTPVDVPGWKDAVSVAVASTTVCGVHRTGVVECWGKGEKGALGDGKTADRPTPARTIAPADAARVVSGGTQSLALRRTGKVTTWGSWAAADKDPTDPHDVAGLDDIVDVAVGDHAACAVHRTGGVDCWGQNLRGALGIGSFTTEPKPTAVKDLPDATAIAMSPGDEFTCAVKRDGHLACWGNPDRGRFGGGKSAYRLTPVAVAGVP